MKEWIKYISVVLIIAISFSSFTQTKEELEKKRKQKEKEIAYTKKLIAQTSDKHKQTVQFLRILQNQIYSREALIKTIGKEIEILEDQIGSNNDIIASLQKDLENLKKEYASMVRFAFKNRNNYSKIGFILSAETVNQSFKRLKMLQHYSEYRKKQMELINETKESIEEKQSILQKQKDQKTRLLNKENKQRNNLLNDRNKKTGLVKSLKQREADLRKDLKEKEEIAEKLRKAIQALITISSKYSETPEAKQLSMQFAKNKGKLPWPVANGFISEAYGKHEHPTIKGIYVFNNGIKISTNKGANARAVFNGRVKNIVTIPGAGNSVLVIHGSYYTVYSNLGEVYVKVDQEVKTKQEIGAIRFNSKTGNTEIDLWMFKDNAKLNPASWLFPK